MKTKPAKTLSIRHKAMLFDYLCRVQHLFRIHGVEMNQVEPDPFLCLASDGHTCWGNTYAEAVREAWRHDLTTGFQSIETMTKRKRRK